jgi:hypothetical protein
MTTAAAATAAAAVHGPGRISTPRPRGQGAQVPPASSASASASSESISTTTVTQGHQQTQQQQQQQQQQQKQPIPQQPRRGVRPATVDPLSDRATTFLIRRILCPQHSDKGKGATAAPATAIDDILPPLTSRNDVDLQLYALIAIILREYVQNWYNKITPDEAFVAEIVQIIAHVTRTLEQRLRKVDLESLLLDEVPGLIDGHITG